MGEQDFAAPERARDFIREVALAGARCFRFKVRRQVHAKDLVDALEVVGAEPADAFFDRRQRRVGFEFGKGQVPARARFRDRFGRIGKGLECAGKHAIGQRAVEQRFGAPRPTGVLDQGQRLGQNRGGVAVGAPERLGGARHRLGDQRERCGRHAGDRVQGFGERGQQRFRGRVRFRARRAGLEQVVELVEREQAVGAAPLLAERLVVGVEVPSPSFEARTRRNQQRRVAQKVGERRPRRIGPRRADQVLGSQPKLALQPTGDGRLVRALVMGARIVHKQVKAAPRTGAIASQGLDPKQRVPGRIRTARPQRHERQTVEIGLAGRLDRTLAGGRGAVGWAFHFGRQFLNVAVTFCLTGVYGGNPEPFEPPSVKPPLDRAYRIAFPSLPHNRQESFLGGSWMSA